MRPQYIRRARRASAAVTAGVLAVAIFDGAASASTAPTYRTAVATARTAAHRRRRHRVEHRGLRLQAAMLHANVLVGQDVAFVGMTRPGAARRLVGVQERVGARWVEVARTRTDARGRFLARYWPSTLGRLQLRLRLAGRSGPTLVAPVATVFHQVVASWYGPGGMTACGEELGPQTLGVANMTLPCGTIVTLRYDGRSLRVPVIDRGPYVAGREFDLTYATKLALGAGDLSVIWASA